MNTEGQPVRGGRMTTVSRFMRGRGRGSRSSRRPYFYHTSNWKKRTRFTVPNVFPQSVAFGSATSALTSESFPRSEFFTAPISASDEELQVIPIINPLQYPGWRLYFPTETFVESSHLVAKIKAFGAHIVRFPSVYILQDIRKKRWFFINAEFLMSDSEFVSSWTNFKQQLQETPKLVLSCLGVAMHHIVTTMAFESNSRLNLYRNSRVSIRKIFARPVNCSAITSIGDITPESCDRLFTIHGRVDCLTAVETKCSWVAYKCKRCGHEQAIRQGDYYPTKPLRCRIQCNSRRNFIELRSSPYTAIDCMQMIKLRETGMQRELCSPLQIDIELREDLIDLVCPGSEITVTGILKIKSLSNQEYQNGPKNKIYIQAVAIVNQINSGSIFHPKPNQKDLDIVQMITSEPNCLRLLVQSLAPEMCGQEMVKAAVLLSLFGGAGSQLHDEEELHVLLVGDPGVGKSNLLKNATSISDAGTLVSGKSPTNLIPTIQQVKLSTGLNIGNFIDAGSILTSHGGHCCIDDMDKCISHQETLIHIMQTKSMSARSISSTFDVATKASVLAAVNPAGGHYDSSKLLRENVRLSPSLLSLFHLVFVLCDKADKDRDNMLADHVKALHSGMKKVLSIPSKYSLELKPNNDILKNDKLELDERLKVNSDEQLDLLPTILLKKYIIYARQNIKPLLTKEAAMEIKDFYLGLRNEKNDEERFSITTRQLEGLIRLAQARARIDLCPEVAKNHTRDIIELVRHSYTDTSVVDRLNSTLNGSISGTSHGSQVKKFIQMLQLKSNALGRKVFEFEELKDMASHAGIRCGVANLVDLVNMQGYLLKKGPNLYEVRTE